MPADAAVFQIKLPATVWFGFCDGEMGGKSVLCILDKSSVVDDLCFAQIAAPAAVPFYTKHRFPDGLNVAVEDFFDGGSYHTLHVLSKDKGRWDIVPFFILADWQPMGARWKKKTKTGRTPVGKQGNRKGCPHRSQTSSIRWICGCTNDNLCLCSVLCFYTSKAKFYK